MSLLLAALVAPACSKSQPAPEPRPPSATLAALDAFFQAGGDAPLTWTGHVTGAIDNPSLPAAYAPLARGYFSVRFDVPLAGGSRLPVSGLFVPDNHGDRLEDAGPAPRYPRFFVDERLQLRAELARRLSVAPQTVPTFARDTLARLGLADTSVVPLLAPPASTCARALDPAVACASDDDLVSAFGLQASFEVALLRSYQHEISAPIAADLLFGQHPGEQKWELPVTLPSPDGAAAESFTWRPVIVARVHATIGAVTAAGLDQADDLFAPLDVWGWVALIRVAEPGAPSAADQQRFADDAAALALENTLPPAEGGFAIETIEMAMARLTGCF